MLCGCFCLCYFKQTPSVFTVVIYFAQLQNISAASAKWIGLFLDLPNSRKKTLRLRSNLNPTGKCRGRCSVKHNEVGKLFGIYSISWLGIKGIGDHGVTTEISGVGLRHWHRSSQSSIWLLNLKKMVFLLVLCCSVDKIVLLFSLPVWWLTYTGMYIHIIIQTTAFAITFQKDF